MSYRQTPRKQNTRTMPEKKSQSSPRCLLEDCNHSKIWSTPKPIKTTDLDENSSGSDEVFDNLVEKDARQNAGSTLKPIKTTNLDASSSSSDERDSSNQNAGNVSGLIGSQKGSTLKPIKTTNLDASSSSSDERDSSNQNSGNLSGLIGSQKGNKINRPNTPHKSSHSKAKGGRNGSPDSKPSQTKTTPAPKTPPSNRALLSPPRAPRNAPGRRRRPRDGTETPTGPPRRNGTKKKHQPSS